MKPFAFGALCSIPLSLWFGVSLAGALAGTATVLAFAIFVLGGKR